MWKETHRGTGRTPTGQCLESKHGPPDCEAHVLTVRPLFCVKKIYIFLLFCAPKLFGRGNKIRTGTVHRLCVRPSSWSPQYFSKSELLARPLIGTKPEIPVHLGQAALALNQRAPPFILSGAHVAEDVAVHTINPTCAGLKAFATRATCTHTITLRNL